MTLVAALGCRLMAGVFFAFSAFVMKALARLPPGEGIAAMQSINVAALYLVGSLLVTIVCNVPKNEALVSVAPADPAGASLWAGYVPSWTAWTHVRTAASPNGFIYLAYVGAVVLALGLLVLGIGLLRKQP